MPGPPRREAKHRLDACVEIMEAVEQSTAGESQDSDTGWVTPGGYFPRALSLCAGFPTRMNSEISRMLPSAPGVAVLCLLTGCRELRQSRGHWLSEQSSAEQRTAEMPVSTQVPEQLAGLSGPALTSLLSKGKDASAGGSVGRCLSDLNQRLKIPKKKLTKDRQSEVGSATPLQKFSLFFLDWEDYGWY